MLSNIKKYNEMILLRKFIRTNEEKFKIEYTPHYYKSIIIIDNITVKSWNSLINIKNTYLEYVKNNFKKIIWNTQRKDRFDDNVFNGSISVELISIDQDGKRYSSIKFNNLGIKRVIDWYKSFFNENKHLHYSIPYKVMIDINLPK